MASSATAPSEFAKLIAYVDELEGGPPPVSLTILAKPKWRIGRIQLALVKEYDRYLSKNYPEFAGAYTVRQYDAFPPKPQFDETDHVSDILEKPKGLVGPHIHILATPEEIEKSEPAATISEPSSPVIEVNDSHRKRILNDSAVDNLRKRSSTQKEHTAPRPSGTLKRPTKTPSLGGASRNRQDAPRGDLYDVGDAREIETSYEDDLSHGGPKSKRARTDAGPSLEAQTPGQKIPDATPTSAQPRPPTVQSTPVVPSSRKRSNLAGPEEPRLASGLWTDRENELMLAEIIKNGADTPTAILRDTLFPGRTTEGIRKKRKKMQNNQMEEILQGRNNPALPMAKTPASSKAPAKAKGSTSKPAVSSKTPSKPKVHAVSGTPAISKTPAKSKTPITFKTPARTKTPARLKSATPRSVSHRRRDSSPVVLIEVVDDPSQTQLEVRPGGAVRVKTPKSSPPSPLETASTTSTEPVRTSTTASTGPVPVSSEHTPSHDSGFDELVAEEEQRQDSIQWLPQTVPTLKTPKYCFKFLQDARAAAASFESAAESQLHRNLPNGTLQSSELVSSVPIIPSSPSPNFTSTNPANHGPPTNVVAPKKRAKSAVDIPDDTVSSSPDEIRSPSPDTAAAWIEVERSSSKAAQASPQWPEDTPIAKSAIANAGAREAVLTARISSIAVQLSPIKQQEDHSRSIRQQSIVADEAEDFETRKSGQTPRTLDFKARTPRSLAKPIASRTWPFEKRDASSEESGSDSSVGDDSNSSADESDADVNINAKTNISAKPKADAKVRVDVNMDDDSDSDSSHHDGDSSADESDTDIDVDAKTQKDVKLEANANHKVAAKAETSVKGDVAHAEYDSSDSSSDSDSSEDGNDAEFEVNALSRVDAKVAKEEVDMNVDAESNSDSSDGDDSDSDIKIDASTKANAKPGISTESQAEVKPKEDAQVGEDISTDGDSESDHPSDSDSSDSSDSESDDTEADVRRNVSKALRALVDAKADSDSDVSSVSSHESDAESSNSDEKDEVDEQSVEVDITGSDADDLAYQQLRSDAEQSQKGHDDVSANDLLTHGVPATKEGRQAKAAETSNDSDSDNGSDSEDTSESEREEESKEEEEEVEENETPSAPMTTSQPSTVKQGKVSHPSPKDSLSTVALPKGSLKKSAMIPAPTTKTQPQAKPASNSKKTTKATKSTQADSFKEQLNRKLLLLMGS